jgi:hypothetical protein
MQDRDLNQLWRQSEFCQEMILSEGGADRQDVARLMAHARRSYVKKRRAALCATVVLLLTFISGLIPARVDKHASHRGPKQPQWKVVSQPFKGVIRSSAQPEMVLRTDKQFFVATVRSESSGTLLEISDEQLMESFPGRAMALIREQGHATLKFLDELVSQ